MTTHYKNRFDKRGCDKKSIEPFLQCCQDREWQIEKATKTQDIKEHWDLKISKNGTSHLVDIKGSVHPSPRKKIEHVVYQRSQWGRKDKLVYLTKQEILSITSTFWGINV